MKRIIAATVLIVCAAYVACGKGPENRMKKASLYAYLFTMGQAAETGDMAITITNPAHAIDGYKPDVLLVKYRIMGQLVGGSGDSFIEEIIYDPVSQTITNTFNKKALRVGSWRINVEAYNGKDEKLMEGEKANIAIKAAQVTPASVDLTACNTGKGKISLNVSWQRYDNQNSSVKKQLVLNPKIVITLDPMKADPSKLVSIIPRSAEYIPDPENQSALQCVRVTCYLDQVDTNGDGVVDAADAKVAGIDPGNYLMTIRLFDGKDNGVDHLVKVENPKQVLILANAETTGSLQWLGGALTGELDLIIRPIWGDSLVATLSGGSAEIVQGATMTITADVQPSTILGVKYDWYLNGTKQSSTANTITVGPDLPKGNYTLGLFATKTYADGNGVITRVLMASAEFSFKVVAP